MGRARPGLREREFVCLSHRLSPCSLTPRHLKRVAPPLVPVPARPRLVVSCRGMARRAVCGLAGILPTVAGAPTSHSSPVRRTQIKQVENRGMSRNARRVLFDIPMQHKTTASLRSQREERKGCARASDWLGAHDLTARCPRRVMPPARARAGTLTGINIMYVRTYVSDTQPREGMRGLSKMRWDVFGCRAGKGISRFDSGMPQRISIPH